MGRHPCLITINNLLRRKKTMVKVRPTEVQNLIYNSEAFKNHLKSTEYCVKALADVVEITTSKKALFVHAASWMLHTIDTKGNKVYDATYLDHVEKGSDLPRNGLLYCSKIKQSMNWKKWFISNLSGKVFHKDTFYFISKTFDMFAVPKDHMDKLTEIVSKYQNDLDAINEPC